jgi:hypothetical protein
MHDHSHCRYSSLTPMFIPVSTSKKMKLVLEKRSFRFDQQTAGTMVWSSNVVSTPLLALIPTLSRHFW